MWVGVCRITFPLLVSTGLEQLGRGGKAVLPCFFGAEVVVGSLDAMNIRVLLELGSGKTVAICLLQKFLLLVFQSADVLKFLALQDSDISLNLSKFFRFAEDSPSSSYKSLQCLCLEKRAVS